MPPQVRKKLHLLVSQQEFKRAIIIQLDYYELTNRDVSELFTAAGITLHESQLSRYLNYKSVLNSLTERQLVYKE